MNFNRQQMQYEPETEKAIAIDWRGSEVFEGEYVYFTPDDEIVLEKDLDDWIEHTFGASIPLHKSDL